MTKSQSINHLYDPRNGDTAIRFSDFCISHQPHSPARTNCFAIYLVESGSGTFWADASRFSFTPGSLLFFVPYQHVRLEADERAKGKIIQFHANFLCIETFHAEVGCSGVLFNDPQGIPVVRLDDAAESTATALFGDLRTEMVSQRLAFEEAMLAHLKLLLILATRVKSREPVASTPAVHNPKHPLLIAFRELIEQHYCSLHAPAEYAKLLHVTPKTLGRIVRENLGTTPTELIRARVLTHAKWQLLHTLKPVKQVAREVGFGDELYFSRLFKKATGYSPKFFREFETEIRGGSNLSMISSDLSISPSDEGDDTLQKQRSI